MKRILLSAVGGAASISIIKYLKKNGYYIIGIDSNIDAVGKYFCDEFYKSPLLSKEKEYIKFLKKIDFDIFFPWLDEEHILFANKKIDKKLLNKIVTSSKSTINIVTNKIKTFEFSIENNINVAKKTNRVPAFVRGSFSRGSKNTFIENNQNNLDKLDNNKFLIQEILDGIEYTVDIVISKDYFFAVPRKRLQATNVSLIGQVDMNIEVIDFCKNITNKLNFFGPINIQIIRSNIDNKLYLIEINPRIAGSSILSINAGFDLFNKSINIFFNKRINTNFKIKDNLKMTRYWSEVFE